MAENLFDHLGLPALDERENVKLPGSALKLKVSSEGAPGTELTFNLRADPTYRADCCLNRLSVFGRLAWQE